MWGLHRLWKAERAFVDRVWRDEEYAPGVPIKIRARVLRDVLLARSNAEIPNRGIRLRGSAGARITVVGNFDLRNAVGAGGSSLAALIATDCDFVDENDPLLGASIDLSHCHIERVSLRESSFARIHASGAQIDGDFDLGTYADLGQSHFKLNGIRVDGSLVLSGRSCCCLPRVSSGGASRLRRSYRRECAVDLSGAEIKDDIVLIGATITGELNLRDAKVDQNVRIMDTRITPVVRQPSNDGLRSIDAQAIRVGGSFIIRGSSTPAGREKNDIVGLILLHAARIDAELVIKDGNFRAAQDSDQAISAEAATIGKSVHFGSSQNRDDQMRVSGNISLDNAIIGGSVMLRHVGPWSATSTCKLRAHGIAVEGRLTIEACEFAVRDEESIRAAAIDLWRCRLELGLRIDRRSVVTGSMRVNNSRIGRDVSIRARFNALAGQPEQDTIATRLDMSSSRIEGSLRINMPAGDTGNGVGASRTQCIVVEGAITLDRTTVLDRVILERIEFRYPALRPPLILTGNPLERAKNREAREAFLMGSNKRVLLDLSSMNAMGGLIVRDLFWTVISGQGTNSEGTRRRFLLKPIRDLAHRDDVAIIDLRGFTCNSLNDEHGKAWGFGDGILLRADQINIGRIDEDEGHHRDRPNRAQKVRWITSSDRRRERIKFLEHQALRIEMIGGWPKPKWWRILDNWQWPKWWRSFEFCAQSYTSFAKAYSNNHLGTARRLLIERTDLEWTRRIRRLLLGEAADHSKPFYMMVSRFYRTFEKPFAAWLWRWEAIRDVVNGLWSTFRALINLPLAIAYALWGFLYRIGFAYGLSPGRAMRTFVLCILIGIAGSYFARNGGFDRFDPPALAVNPLPDDIVLVRHSDITRLRSGSETGAVQLAAADEVCPVDSLNFALDLFIPVVDFYEGSECEVRSDPTPGDGKDPYLLWRYISLCYSLLGWIVTSVTILTISGVIRRDIDR